MLTYFSKAWSEACRESINNSEKHLKNAKKLNGTWDFRVLDGPDGKDRHVTWTFENGKATDLKFECKPAPWTELRAIPFNPDLVARFTAPLEMMAKLNKGEIGPLKALSSPEYHMEGKKMKIISMIQGVNSWNYHNAQIECNYEFIQTDDDGAEI